MASASFRICPDWIHWAYGLPEPLGPKPSQPVKTKLVPRYESEPVMPPFRVGADLAATEELAPLIMLEKLGFI